MNFYKKISNEISSMLNEYYFNHTIEPDTMQKELVVTFNEPLFGESHNYADAALDSAVSYIQTLMGLKHRPNYTIISPTQAIVQKEFSDSDFARY